MKVLLTTPSYFPIVGGSETLTRALAHTLNEQGITTDVMTFNMQKKWSPLWKLETSKDGPTVIFKEAAFNPLRDLPNPLSNVFRVNVFPNPNFAKKLREYDVIHFISEADLSFPAFSLFVKRPKLFHCCALYARGGIYKYYTSDRPPFGRFFRKFFPHLADAFIVSSLEEKTLLSGLNVAPSRIFVIPQGVDIRTFRPDLSKKIENLVLFVGRIDKIKGLHVLLDALHYIETPVHLTAIGPILDQAYAEKLRKETLAINGKSQHSVTFLGSLDQKDLAEWYQKASVLVCPYLYEACSSVIRESLASGTPVISTGSHLTEDGRDGILLTSRNPQSLARSVDSLLRDRRKREILGKEGRRTIELHFSWHHFARKLVELYLDLQR
jgi:glycosyltransferase involved in cell wall biosynthesis